MNHNIFISVHDQELILELEKNNIFRYLKEYKYLFLGMRPTDKLDHLKNKVIIARELQDNIEKDTSLFDYTGWYALVKNDLITEDYVTIIHYDCFIFKNFEKQILKTFEHNKNCFISFLPCELKTDVYFSKTFSNAITLGTKEIYNIDLEDLIKNELKKGKSYWATGGSFACNKKWIEGYINWMEPMRNILLQDKMASHNIERSSKIYNLTHNIKEKYLPDIMRHIYNSSHNQNYNLEEEKEKQRKLFKKFIQGHMHNEYYGLNLSLFEKIKILYLLLFL